MIGISKVEALKHVNNIINLNVTPDKKDKDVYSELHAETINALDSEFILTFRGAIRLFCSENGYKEADESRRMPESIKNIRIEEVRKHKAEKDGDKTDDIFSVKSAIKFLREEACIPRIEASKHNEHIIKQETLVKIINPRTRAQKAVIENYAESRFPNNKNEQEKMLKIFGYCQKSKMSFDFSKIWNSYDCCCSKTTLVNTENLTYNSHIHTIRRFAIVSASKSAVITESDDSQNYEKAKDFLREFYRNYGFELENGGNDINSVIDVGDRLTLSFIANDYFGKMYANDPKNETHAPFWYYIYVLEHLNSVEFSFAKETLGLSNFGYFMVDAAANDLTGMQIEERLNFRKKNQQKNTL